MSERPEIPPLWIPGVQRIQDPGLRERVLRAAERMWGHMVAYSDNRLHEAVDAAQILDAVVDGVVAAHAKNDIRDFESYLFVGFVRKTARFFRREQKVEYRAPQRLAALKESVDTEWVTKLEDELQVKELVSWMDERTRTIFAMLSQGFAEKEIGKALGMTQGAVRMSFARGIERIRRRARADPKTESGSSR